MEAIRSNQEVYLSQHMYVMDLLEESSMLGHKLIDSPIDPNAKFGTDEEELFPNPSKYIKMVDKLTYLKIMRPDILFIVGVVSQFMCNQRQPHWDAVCKSLGYLKHGPRKGLFYMSSDNLDVISYPDTNWVGNQLTRDLYLCIIPLLLEIWSHGRVRSKL